MEMQIHVVQQGETLFSIGNRYNISPEKLIYDNQLEYPDRLVTGQALAIIREEAGTYAVRPGDTFYTIAASFGISFSALLLANPEITNVNMIFPGQIIRLPGVSSTQPKKSIFVNGYCYPHINTDVLTQTLPYLTFLSLFSYNVNTDGTLVSIQTAPLIARARERNVAPLMVLTNLGPSGNFSGEQISPVLNDTQRQDVLIEAVLRTLRESGYHGVDVDFEYVLGRDRDAYSRFLARLAGRLRPLGYSTSSAVPAKTSANQPGNLYAGIDYAAHGRAMDMVLLMTYDWGYRYGPPMAVSPLHRMEEVVQFAVTEIPREKILLGIPNYGYDWALPYQSGEPARLIMNNAAVSLAATHWAPIRFDAQSQTPYFHYWEATGRERVVWFDDARSFQAKLGLVEKYNLGGIGYWNIHTLFRPGWLVLSSMYDVRKV